MDQFPPQQPPSYIPPPPPPPPVPPIQQQISTEVPQVPWRAREALFVLILGLASGFFFTALAAARLEDRDLLTLVATILIEASLGGWVLLWVKIRHGLGGRALGLHFKPEDLGAGALGAIVGFVVSGIVSQLITSIWESVTDKKLVEPQQLPESLSGSRVALAVLAVVIVAPLAEELFFRGFLYQALRKWRGVSQAMVLSALLFAIAHGHPLLILAIFPLGVILAYVFERRNSLAATITAHALFNGVGLVFILSR